MPEIAIIGGSGLYSAEGLTNIEEVKVHTPYGKPSDSIIIGTFNGMKIAFLSRHGRGHQYPAHLVNYRANIWALKELGVKRILAVSSCGSLREDFAPGDIIVLDQFIDRTAGRVSTFYEGSKTCHISTAEPFCPQLRSALFSTGQKLSLPLKPTGTYICIQGPRFSTKAESNLFRKWDADVVGMTLVPEAVLAREAELCYANISLVTDYDCWKDSHVSIQEVLKVMGTNVEKARRLLFSAIEILPTERSCPCSTALKDALL